MGHFSPRALAAAMSLTVTRPGFLPPYRASDWASGWDSAFVADCMAGDDIVGTSKSLEAPLLAYPDTSIIARRRRARIFGCPVTWLSVQAFPPPMTSFARTTNAVV